MRYTSLQSRTNRVEVKSISASGDVRPHISPLRLLRTVFVLYTFGFAQMSLSQTSMEAQTGQQLPPAPSPQAAPAPPISVPADAINKGLVMALSLKDAEDLAVKNNPQISVARLTALASRQV